MIIGFEASLIDISFDDLFLPRKKNKFIKPWFILLLIQLYWDNLSMNSFEFMCCEVSKVLRKIDPWFQFYKTSAYTSVISVQLVVALHDTKCTCMCSSTSTCIALSTLYRLETLLVYGPRTTKDPEYASCPKYFGSWNTNSFGTFVNHASFLLRKPVNIYLVITVL